MKRQKNFPLRTKTDALVFRELRLSFLYMNEKKNNYPKTLKLPIKKSFFFCVLTKINLHETIFLKFKKKKNLNECPGGTKKRETPLKQGNNG